MGTPDARTISNDSLEQLRSQAVCLSRRGETNTAIAEIHCVNWRAVWRWLKRYATVGAAVLRAKRRGRKVGEQRTLAPDQEAEVQRLLVDKTPDQLKLTFALWSRQAVRELLRVRLAFRMPIRTVGEYSRSWASRPRSRSSGPTSRALQPSSAG
jgi:transposase